MKKLAAPSDLSSNTPQANTPPQVRSFAQSPVRMRRGLWPLADGYLESNVVGGFLRGLMWFVGLFLSFVLVSGAQKVTQQKMPLSLLVQFMALQVPRIVVFTIPSALLFGTVSTFTEMSSRGELTALMAGGMSLRRMLRAPLTAALVLAVFAFWLQETVVPQCELKRGAIGVAALQNAKASQIFPLVSKNKTTGKVERIIEADEFDAKNLVMKNPDIRIYQPDGSSLHISAQSGRWDKKRGEWVFKWGRTAREPPRAFSDKTGRSGYTNNPFQEESFKTEMSLDPADLSKGGARDLPAQLEAHNFEMVSLGELRAYRSGLIERAHRAQNELGAAPQSADKTEEARARLEIAKSEARAATFGIHDKLATPLIVFAMVLIGAPLGVRPQRTASAGLALGVSLMVLLGYYVVWTLTSQWGKGGGPQPMLAAYLPFGILAGLGIFLTWRKG